MKLPSPAACDILAINTSRGVWVQLLCRQLVFLRTRSRESLEGGCGNGAFFSLKESTDRASSKNLYCRKTGFLDSNLVYYGSAGQLFYALANLAPPRLKHNSPTHLKGSSRQFVAHAVAVSVSVCLSSKTHRSKHKMKVGLSLIIFLSSAFCVARCSTFSAPYFEDGENLSYKDCGVWDRSSANRSSWIAILVQNQKQCFGIVISPRAILTLECEINMEEKENIQAFVGDCGTVYSRNETACTNQTIEVQDVIELNKNPRAAERVLLHLIITKKMSSISPICLFNRAKYSDVVEQTNKNYFALQRWQNPQEKQSWDNLAPRQIVPFENCFSNSSNLTELYEKLELAPQSLLCVRASDNFNDISLVNSYKQRYFLRGLRVNHGLLKEPSNHRIIIDILPYIDMIAKYTKDIPVLPRIPPAHPKKGLNTKSLSFPKCGLTPDALENNGGKLKSEFGETQRLYGGYDSTPDAHPWHAQVENTQTISICGGTLISTKVVLTAAHCIFGLNASDFDVTIGVYDRKSAYSPKIQLNTPSRLISHPNYTSGQFHYDIGLMIFDEEQFNITEHVRPICLWNEDASLERVSESQAVVIGFGITDSNKTLPETLQEAKLQIRSHKVCYLSNKRFFQKYLKPGDNFCAGYTNGTTACHGDSGGSLSLEKNGRWFIRGIVSFGILKKSANASGGAQETVCNPNSYSLFTDVANYMDWILENAPEVYEYYEEETLQTSIFPDFSWSVLILALVIIFFVYILFKYN